MRRSFETQLRCESGSVYLEHILDAIARIERYSAVGQERFLAEPHWQDATIRQLEVIGEATKRLSPELRDHHPEVAWRRVAGLRDVLIHDYMGVDLDIVWGVIQRALPDFKRQIQAILGEADRVLIRSATPMRSRLSHADAVHALRWTRKAACILADDLADVLRQPPCPPPRIHLMPNGILCALRSE